MQTSKKAKTPSAATLEVSIINPTRKGTNIMKNDTSLVNKSQLTMSSREIASLTNKRHDNICRDIRAILVALLGGEEADYVRNSNLSYLTNQHVSCNQYNSKNPNAWEYHISRRYTEILITGYDIKRRTAVIDRLYELEEANRTTHSKLPTTKELAIMVIQAEEENERLLIENKTLGTQLEEMKPTVEAFDRIATKAEGSMCVTDTAKHLQVQPRKFFQELNAMGWIYKRTGCSHWLGYQDKVKQGLLEHKVTTVSRSDGSEKIVEQVLVTPKGLAKLSQILTMH
ncbi:phage regulatory protein/antirepressor Ant [Gilliamella sp. B3482]|uniref:phage antirepressor KilAC domain-containing protein n=1 Tax=Gilliamella sp. B3482 TaxID=2817991 RepID=UPI00226AF554|nr:phage antirepressor KilAC domain-containing protein [Gilliamella sp. B3482]MCX8581155.1 phage regulatory protein/antirepressor Ant [Gilliamella sp. B3482]